MIESRIIRCGNSSAVVVRSEFMRALNLKRGDLVRIKYDEQKGLMSIHFPAARQLRLASLNKG